MQTDSFFGWNRVSGTICGENHFSLKHDLIFLECGRHHSTSIWAMTHYYFSFLNYESYVRHPEWKKNHSSSKTWFHEKCDIMESSLHFKESYFPPPHTDWYYLEHFFLARFAFLISCISSRSLLDLSREFYTPSKIRPQMFVFQRYQDK